MKYSLGKGFEHSFTKQVQDYSIQRFKNLALSSAIAGQIGKLSDETTILSAVWLLDSLWRLIQQALSMGASPCTPNLDLSGTGLEKGFKNKSHLQVNATGIRFG